jgi:hypothetical protein
MPIATLLTTATLITLIDSQGVLTVTGLTVDMTNGGHAQASTGINLQAPRSSVTGSTIKVSNSRGCHRYQTSKLGRTHPLLTITSLLASVPELELTVALTSPLFAITPLWEALHNNFNNNFLGTFTNKVLP